MIVILDLLTILCSTFDALQKAECKPSEDLEIDQRNCAFAYGANVT
jgi:hypothetical protein